MSAVICPWCDSPDVPWLGQLGHQHYYRCTACGLDVRGPDPYWPDWAEED